MANNVPITAGSGTTIAADDVAGVQYQRVKLVDGTEDSSAVIPGDAANGLDVDVTRVSGNVTVVDGGGTLSVDDGAGSLTVDGTVAATQSGTWNIATVTAVTGLTNALPAGTNAIGKLAANAGVNIGDVGVTAIVPGTGATNLGKVEDAAHTTGDVGVMALGVRNTGRAALTNANADYSPLAVNDLGDQYVALPGIISAVNSTTAPLAAGATFTGTAEDISNYVGLAISVKADKASAAFGLKILFGPDGTNWDTIEEYTILANVGRPIHTSKKGKFAQVTYTNGDTAQGAFRLQTAYNYVPFQDDAMLRAELPPGVRDNLGGSFDPVHDDSFNRGPTTASQWGLGVSDTGLPWQTTGADFAQTNINAAGYFNLGGVGAAGRTCYAYVFLDSPVARMGGVVRFTTGSGSAASGDCVLICGSAAAISSWVHCQTTMTGWTIDVIDAAGGFTTLFSGSYGTALTLDRDYFVQVTIQGDTVIFQTADGGTQRVADARIQAFANNMAMIELLSSGASVREPMWKRHWAYTRKQAPMITPKRAMAVAIADSIPSKATYRAATINVSSGALTINTFKNLVTLHHAATVNQNVVIRKITATITGNTVAGTLSLQMFAVTSAPTGGSTITPAPVNRGDAAAGTTVTSLPTGGAAVTGGSYIAQSYNLGIVAANTDASKLNQLVLYEYQSANDSKPLMIRRNSLEGFAFGCQSTAASTVTLSIEIEFTEE